MGEGMPKDETRELIAEKLDEIGRDRVNQFTHDLNRMILEEWKERAERYEEALKVILGWPEFDTQDSDNPGRAIIQRIEETARAALGGDE